MSAAPRRVVSGAPASSPAGRAASRRPPAPAPRRRRASRRDAGAPTFTACLLLLLFLAAPLLAETQSFKPTVPDVEVVTQEGKTVHFYSDLVKGKVVAVNFIFTNCKTICPPLAAMFANLQKQTNLGVQYISVSIDPVNDTPRRLKAFGAKFNAQPGWTLVTGKQSDIDTILQAFGAWTARPQEHNPITIIGSDVTGVWTRTYGFPGSAQLAGLVEQVRNGR